jgi:transposase-like protein
MDELTTKNQSPLCPSCGSSSTRRSKRSGPSEWVFHHFLFRSPYRCESCDERFFHQRLSRDQKKQLSIRKDTHPESAAAEEQGSLPGFHHPV